MTTPPQATRKIFDVRDVPAGADRALAATENPKHRHMLKNYRRHGLLEVAGRWPEVLGHLRGMAAIRAFYKGLFESDSNVFGQLWEEVAVSDYGVYAEGRIGWVVPGTSPMLARDGVDPARTYQIEQSFATVWPYVAGRLVGENLYMDNYSREVHEVPAGSITTRERAAELLAPLIEETPLTDIVEGLELFRHV